MGAHPHVAEEVEVYKNHAIFYSLGNAMFDQDFSWETTHSTALRIDFDENDTRFTLTPLTISDKKLSIAQGEDKARILEILGVGESFALRQGP